MHVETLIYVYLAVCLAMIVFNCACIIVFRRRDRVLKRHSARLGNEIEDQLQIMHHEGAVSEKHVSYLQRKMRRISNLIVFDQTMERAIREKPDEAWKYIENIRPVFTRSATELRYKDSMQRAYFAYVIGKYRILAEKTEPLIMETMIGLLQEDSLYSRENAMHAIYSAGDPRYVLKALRKVDESGHFHHEKLLTDGLLTFTGDHRQLAQLLWEQLECFSSSMQVVILDYIRYSGTEMNDEFLLLMSDEGRDDEIRFACIRYFGKHYYEFAYPILLTFLEHPESHRWEYAAIAATAIAAYPGEHTVLALKRALNDQNWYIRFNAAKTLESFHLTYQELGDVLDGKDRYAREILQYQMDIQRAREEQEAMRP